MPATSEPMAEDLQSVSRPSDFAEKVLGIPRGTPLTMTQVSEIRKQFMRFKASRAASTLKQADSSALASQKEKLLSAAGAFDADPEKGIKTGLAILKEVESIAANDFTGSEPNPELMQLRAGAIGLIMREYQRAYGVDLYEKGKSDPRLEQIISQFRAQGQVPPPSASQPGQTGRMLSPEHQQRYNEFRQRQGETAELPAPAPSATAATSPVPSPAAVGPSDVSEYSATGNTVRSPDGSVWAEYRFSDGTTKWRKISDSQKGSPKNNGSTPPRPAPPGSQIGQKYRFQR